MHGGRNGVNSCGGSSSGKSDTSKNVIYVFVRVLKIICCLKTWERAKTGMKGTAQSPDAWPGNLGSFGGPPYDALGWFFSHLSKMSSIMVMDELRRDRLVTRIRQP